MATNTKKQDTTKIDKKARLAEIDAELKKCETYLKSDVDPMAESRVKALDSNPCVSRNVLFKCCI